MRNCLINHQIGSPSKGITSIVDKTALYETCESSNSEPFTNFKKEMTRSAESKDQLYLRLHHIDDVKSDFKVVHQSLAGKLPDVHSYLDAELVKQYRSHPEIDYRDLKKYMQIRRSFNQRTASKEMVDELYTLADKGIYHAAIDIGHYTCINRSELLRAKTALEKVEHPYALHLLGLLAVQEHKREVALEYLLKALNRGVKTSLNMIEYLVEDNPEFKEGKFKEQVKKAMEEYESCI